MLSTSSAGNIFMFLSLIFTSSKVFVNFCVILKDETLILGGRDIIYADIYNCKVILMFL